MKIQKRDLSILLYGCSLLFTGCVLETRNMTEKYIKTNVEVHKNGEFSSISTYSIYKSYPSSYSSSYLEFTGYKYGSKKGLIIGADKYYLDREKFKGDNTTIAKVVYIELTIPECQAIPCWQVFV